MKRLGNKELGQLLGEIRDLNQQIDNAGVMSIKPLVKQVADKNLQLMTELVAREVERG